MDKQEIKRAYKQTKRPMGIYWIRNPDSNKVFVGRAVDLNAIFNRHKTELKFGSHRNKELQEMWNSVGEANVEFEILDVLDHDKNSQSNPAEELPVLMDMWIQKLKDRGETVVSL